jgi:tRNA dimethylallyltransferase
MPLIKKLPLIVIVGPTASGKSVLAIRLAKKFGGEIICADSRTVYIDMDIGTAKPTARERAEVPHFGLDLVEPGEPFSAADFKAYANQKIDEIRKRGNIPFLVGGTGLYIDAVIFDYEFGSKADPVLRKELEERSLTELHEYCRVHDIPLPENIANKRYVIRSIERKGRLVSRKKIPADSTIIVGVATEKEELLSRIHTRTEHIFENDVVDEATLLGKKYGWKSEAMTGNIYRLLYHYLEGELSIDQVKDKFTTQDWHLAKRQLTWLRRNHYIMWLSLDEAFSYLEVILARE